MAPPGDSGVICFNKFRAREEEKIEDLHGCSIVWANFQYNNQLDIVFKLLIACEVLMLTSVLADKFGSLAQAEAAKWWV